MYSSHFSWVSISTLSQKYLHFAPCSRYEKVVKHLRWPNPSTRWEVSKNVPNIVGFILKVGLRNFQMVAHLMNTNDFLLWLKKRGERLRQHGKNTIWLDKKKVAHICVSFLSYKTTIKRSVLTTWYDTWHISCLKIEFYMKMTYSSEEKSAH